MSKQVREDDQLTVGLAQIAPVWLNRDQTLEKIMSYTTDAAEKGGQLVVFGEGLLPGYPFWVERTDGARFNSSVQKEIHAHYLDQAVEIEAGHLDRLKNLAAQKNIAVYLGTIERPADRGGHSVYCTLVYIDQNGQIGSVHRKLMPTYEERLTWSPGDGHGLRTHPLPPFTVGGLNCWENWMPLARTALYGMGEDLHVAVWPGAVRNTEEITRFIAVESRSYVVSVSGLMRKSDFPADTPHLDKIVAEGGEMISNGGSCIAGPSGQWVIPPKADEEILMIATLDHKEVRRERQNFDAVGHYSRPDVLRLEVDRRRQSSVVITE